MPFSPEVKSQMFIESARICCLCFKQCGTKIEAAHIVDEHDGGPNTFENGIPACFECHAEIGHYNAKHPKGNKFRPEELRARRDAVYKWVRSGSFQAQIIAAQLNKNTSSADLNLVGHAQKSPISENVIQMLNQARTWTTSPKSLANKLRLLEGQDRAIYFDEAIKKCEEDNMLEALLGLLHLWANEDEKRLVLEGLTKKVVLSAKAGVKARFIQNLNPDMLRDIDPALTEALYQDLVVTMEANQFGDVNAVVPKLSIAFLEASPVSVRAELVQALIWQTDSGGFSSGPAARKLLDKMPLTLVRAFLKEPIKGLDSLSSNVHFRKFLVKHKLIWPKAKKVRLALENAAAGKRSDDDDDTPF